MGTNGSEDGIVNLERYRIVEADAQGRARDQRDRIIAATMHVVGREGVSEATTRGIAREAGVNLAALHYCFGNKNNLLMAVLETATSVITNALLADVRAGCGLQRALAASLATLWSLSDQTPSIPLVRCEVLLNASWHLGEARVVREQQQRYLDALEAVYRTGRTPGETSIIPLDELAVFVSCGVDGLTLHAASWALSDEPERARNQLLRAALGLTSVSARVAYDRSRVIPEDAP